MITVTVTVYSFFMAVLCSTVLILLAHGLRKKSAFIRNFGVSTLLFFYALCWIRMTFPFEFPFVQEIGLEHGYSDFFQIVQHEEFQMGQVTFRILDLATVVWVIGAICLVVLFLVRYLMGRRKLARFEQNRTPLADGVLEKVKKEARYNLPVKVLLCPEMGIPMGIGILKKRILLPQRTYTEEELYFILKHEYTHFCNHDLAVKFLICLFCCIFWWNPVVYLLRQDVGEILEIKCDLTVAEDFSKREKEGYLTVILQFLKQPARRETKGLASVTARLFSKKKGQIMVERFRYLTQPVRKAVFWNRLAILAVSVALFFVSYVFVLQPSYNPPVSDFAGENGRGFEIDISNDTIIRCSDGSYKILTESGNVIPLAEETVEVLLDQGYQLREE